MIARAKPIVAIDGPAGAGKSTVARRLADALGFVLVDTGALYRAVALAAKRAGTPWEAAGPLEALVAGIVARGGLALEPAEGGGVRVLLDGEDVSEAIRTPDIAQGASKVSAHGGVRDRLLDLQRAAGRGGGVVLEGRDIGTVVFPDADVKFYLTASPEIRAERRHAELVAKGDPATFEATLEEVLQRDARDTGRPVAPLRQAEGSTLIDSSHLTLNQVVEAMVGEVSRVMGR